jgi:hypothetical protein
MDTWSGCSIRSRKKALNYYGELGLTSSGSHLFCHQKLNYMYLIINRTSGKTTPLESNFPLELVEELLLKGDDIIIISLYSQTIKIPTGFNSAISEWEWKEYPLPIKAISDHLNNKERYYNYGSYVISVPASTNYKDIVRRMRQEVNKDLLVPITIMWEDIAELDESEFLAYKEKGF